MYPVDYLYIYIQNSEHGTTIYLSNLLCFIDNRFILKQMSSTEVEIFEKFGFEYFQYISKCYMEQV